MLWISEIVRLYPSESFPLDLITQSDELADIKKLIKNLYRVLLEFHVQKSFNNPPDEALFAH